MADAQLMEGVVISFASLFGKILSVNWTGITRAIIEASDLNKTGGKDFLGSARYDPGELSVEMQYDSAIDPAATMIALKSALTVTYFDSHVMSSNALLTGWEISGGDDETIKVSATMKLTGTVTF